MEIVISQRCSIIYAAANHLRRRSDGPSYSGNLPNLIVLGGFFRFFFFCFCCIGFGIYSVDARNGRARGMRRSRDRIVSRVIQGRISRKFIRTFRNVRNFNFIR